MQYDNRDEKGTPSIWALREQILGWTLSVEAKPERTIHREQYGRRRTLQPTSTPTENGPSMYKFSTDLIDAEVCSHPRLAAKHFVNAITLVAGRGKR